MNKINPSLPLYEFVIDENDSPEIGLTATSLVNDPANGHHFVAFSSQEPDGMFVSLSKDAPVKEFQFDATKKRITGVLLEPDQLIYRRNDTLGEYNVRFTADAIEKLLYRYGKNLRFGAVTLGHQEETSSVYIAEIWLAGQIDKSKELGINAKPGSLVATYVVEDPAIMLSVQDGTFNGFSIEGRLPMRFVEMASQEEPKQDIEKEFLASLNDDSKTEEEQIAMIKSLLLGK